MTVRSDFPVLHPMRVRFIEVDRQGILHNAHYLMYFGVGLNEYYRELGYDRVARGEKAGTALHVVSANVTYKAPLTFDELIEIGVRIRRIGRTSAVFSYALFKQDREEPAASGEQVWVHTDKASHKGVPWPDDFIALVEKFVGGKLER